MSGGCPYSSQVQEKGYVVWEGLDEWYVILKRWQTMLVYGNLPSKCYGFVILVKVWHKGWWKVEVIPLGRRPTGRTRSLVSLNSVVPFIPEFAEDDVKDGIARIRWLEKRMCENWGAEAEELASAIGGRLSGYCDRTAAVAAKYLLYREDGDEFERAFIAFARKHGGVCIARIEGDGEIVCYNRRARLIAHYWTRDGNKTEELARILGVERDSGLVMMPLKSAEARLCDAFTSESVVASEIARRAEFRRVLDGCVAMKVYDLEKML